MLGQTTGTGADAQITLDTDAAGYGWFVDQTPDDNSEFLPTADPNVWIAKPGSAAAGHMDMLSVLMHEYGHVLGLEHSADSSDAMGATLKPGERRLWSAAEIEKLKSMSTAQVAADGALLDKEGNPSPLAPLTTSSLLASLGLISRRRSSGAMAVGADNLTAANPALVHGDLSDASGWTHDGAVSFGADGARLAERSDAQSSLRQVFTLGEHDRFLRFTLSGDLKDQANGPNDAFEAALLDANTGAALRSVDGLTHSDAFLNIQAPHAGLAGLVRSASGLVVTDNADGSRTYTLDLAGIPTGTAMELSFDLLGFGEADSAMLVRDVQVLSDLQARDDVAQTAEDTPIRIDVMGNDVVSAPDGVQPVLVAAPQHGRVSLNADGSFSYTPDANWSGSDSFSYALKSATQTSEAATVTLTVTPVDDAPVASDATVSLLEDGRATVDLVALGSDVEGDALTAVIVAGPAHGTLTLDADGHYVYTPAANFNGVDSVRFALSDGQLLSNEATVSFAVAPVNDAPVVASGEISAATLEDTPVTLDLLADASDVDGDALQVQILAGPAHGKLSLASDGRYVYLADANYFGTDSFTWCASDGSAQSAAVTVAISIAPVDDAPLAHDAELSLPEDGKLLLDFSAYGSDIEGDALTAVIVSGPAHGRLDRNADGSYVYVPAADYNGLDSVRFQLNDGQLLSNEAELRFTVLPVEDAPVLADQAVATDEDTPLKLDLLASAHDVDGDALNVIIVTAPAHGTLVQGQDGHYLYQPAANFSGSDSFSYKVSDGQLDSALATVSIAVTPVADAPTLSLGSASVSTELFRTGWETVANPDRTSTLIERPTLEGWKLITDPAGCWWLSGRDGFEVWSSGDRMANASGALAPVSAKDGDGRNWLELNAAAGDMPQTLGIRRSVQTVAGAQYALSFDYAGRIGYDAGYTRIGIYVDGVRLASVATTSPSDQLNWQALSYCFTGNGCEQDIAFVCEGSRRDWDGRGAMLDNIALTETRVFNAGPEDSAIALNPIRAALTDADGSEQLTLSLIGLPAGASLTDGRHTAKAGGDALDITGWALDRLSLTPPQDFNGRLTLTVRATSTETANGASASTEQSFDVLVTPVDDAPTLAGRSITLAEDSAVTLDLLSTAHDVEGDALNVIVVTAPAHGTLTRGQDGHYVYQPAANFSGFDSFSYRVSDGQLDSALATVSIVVTPVADTPLLSLDSARTELFRTGWETVANPDRTSTLIEQPTLEGWTLITDPASCWWMSGRDGFEVWSSGDRMSNAAGDQRLVSAKDGDGRNWLELNAAAGDMPQTLGIRRSVQTVAGAQYSLSFDFAGRVGYDAGYTRIGIYVDGVRLASVANTSPSDQLTWQALSYSFTGNGREQDIAFVCEGSRRDWDGRGAMLDNIALTETRVFNAGPEDSAIALNPIRAALTDTDGSERLTLSLIGLPAGASLTDGRHTAKAGGDALDITGWALDRLSLTPPQDFNGRLTLTVRATSTETANGASASTEESFDVLVTPVDDGPTLAGRSITLAEDSAVTLDLLSTAHDVEGDALNVIVVTVPAHGTLVQDKDGRYVYQPAANFSGFDSFSYRVSDGQLDSALATVSIAVTPVNDAPTLAAIADRTIREGESLRVKLDGADVDNDALTYALVSAPAGATIDPRTHEIVWANPDGPALVDFTVEVRDPSGASARQSFKVLVLDVPPQLSVTGNPSAATLYGFDSRPGTTDSEPFRVDNPLPQSPPRSRGGPGSESPRIP